MHWRYAVVVVVTLLALAACSVQNPFVVSTPTPVSTVVVGPGSCPRWTNPPAAVDIPPPAQQTTYAIAERTAQQVLRTPRPIRNLYSITQHMAKHLSDPISCLVRTSPRDEHVGDVRTFWVTNPNQVGYHQVRARLDYATPHLYMYVEQGAQTDLSALKSSADRFESQSFPTDERTYGPHWSPGVDADPHVTVLNATNMGNVGGYFSSEDEFPRAVSPYSNERAMIYVNLDGGAVPGQEFYDATLAHEFQHMIHWYWHPADPSWVNEGMSVLAQHINHLTAAGLDSAFLQQPDTMLGGWTDDTPAMAANYGAGYLFNDYFAEHYGGYGVLRELVTSPEQVPLNYDAVLQAHGYRDRFADVFAKFVVANLVNDPSMLGLLNGPSVERGVYAYPSIPDERARPQHIVTAYPYVDGGAASPAAVHQYATQYYELRPPSSSANLLTISFAARPYVHLVNNQPYGGATNEWWSNSGNDMDSTLTRAFDLTSLAGKPVTLTFHAWYDLEPGFDYGYVAVSTDGGQNWTTLPATTSATSNPNGANYGHGFTSQSTSPAGCQSTAQWQPETVDLSAYAGQKILLRFETITDDAVHCQGLTLDDIQIPQLGFRDDAVSDNGWQAEGFIRSPNLLPQQFVVQAVLFPQGNGQPSVTQILVDPRTGAASV
ncbi:MAG TPA: hypothetical protein VF818_11240, partial [Ktedonobacterales bacterium]